MADQWSVKPGDTELARRLASELGVRPLTARILLSRGIVAREAGQRFLSPKLGDLRPPDGIADLGIALDRIQCAIERHERVGVFGDYDVDGVTSAAILCLTLQAYGLEVIPRVAKRASGYGFSPDAAEAFLAAGATLILTGDCGTSDRDALSICKRRGVDVIVIDHHQVPSGESLAAALLNPRRVDDQFAFKGLASCGVAFYVAAALRSRLRAAGNPYAASHEPRSVLDLVALGTIADMVPLVEENRVLASAGLKELAKRERPGIAALAAEAGLPPGSLTATDVSFRLAPRLNAAGRIGDAQVALDLFLTANPAKARELAATLEGLNRDRRLVQERIWEEALVEAKRWEDAPALVLGSEGWHQGVVGIVAAKLVERFNKPAIVLGFANGLGRGSARTVGGFDLYQSLSRCREHLDVFGGHSVAAGLSLSMDQLDSFRRAFLSLAKEHFLLSPRVETVEADASARISELDTLQIEELERLGPFGNANPEPLLALEGVHTRSTRIVGGSHLQLTIADGANTLDGIAFGMAGSDPGQGASIVAIGVAESDDFRGYRRPRFRLRHLFRNRS